MIVNTKGKISNIFFTVTNFNKEYRTLKIFLKEQLKIDRIPHCSSIIKLWGDLLHNDTFLPITDGTKEEMMYYIKNHKNTKFKLELLPCTIKINK